MRKHPCAGWCGERLRGVVANVRLRENLPELEVEIRCRRPFMPREAAWLTLECEHGRLYFLRSVTRPDTVS